jgi:NAD(P)-dependent dehydrogenase (short-subunit alcohol dehydrogenase family)
MCLESLLLFTNWLLTSSCSPVQVLCRGMKRDDLPYGSVGPNDVAEGIAFLASEAAKAVSGILMPIDNAWSTI